jgi:hypothetical protein
MQATMHWIRDRRGSVTWEPIDPYPYARYCAEDGEIRCKTEAWQAILIVPVDIDGERHLALYAAPWRRGWLASAADACLRGAGALFSDRRSAASREPAEERIRERARRDVLARLGRSQGSG